MAKIKKILTFSEAKWGYLCVTRYLKPWLPRPKQPIKVVDADGEAFTTKMHSAQSRIDGLTGLYHKHNARKGCAVNVEVSPENGSCVNVVFH